MDVRSLFGKNVARLRASRGLSQTQLVFLLDPSGQGISQSYLSQLEAGKRNPKLSTIVEIASALDVGIEELVAEDVTTDTPQRRKAAAPSPRRR